MKKRFINDWTAFCYLMFCIIGCIPFLIITFLSGPGIGQYVLFCFFGGLELISLVIFIINFDIIIISDDKITRWKIFKRKTILYSEIQSIKEMHNIGAGMGVNDYWEIRSFDDEIIDFLRGERRKKFVETIQNKIKDNLYNYDFMGDLEPIDIFITPNKQKRFINHDILLIMTVTTCFLLITVSIVFSFVSFSLFVFYAVLALLIVPFIIYSLDIVTISNEMITRWKFGKRETILRSEIECIRKIEHKFGYRLDAWEIKSLDEKTIYLRITRKTRKYIKYRKRTEKSI